MIFPIVNQLNTRSAFFVSIAAGVGEELFFRGFLQPKLGIVIVSILFGLVHFIFNFKKYFFVILIYVGIGFLFGLVYEVSQTLWVPVVFHVLYDFSAILYFKNKIKSSQL